MCAKTYEKEQTQIIQKLLDEDLTKSSLRPNWNIVLVPTLLILKLIRQKVKISPQKPEKIEEKDIEVAHTNKPYEFLSNAD